MGEGRGSRATLQGRRVLKYRVIEKDDLPPRFNAILLFHYPFSLNSIRFLGLKETTMK